jgi:hypothetical protein
MKRAPNSKTRHSLASALPRRARIFGTACAGLLLSGCACIEENSLTARLWTSHDFSEFRSASTNLPIELYRSADANDFLIVYTEVSDNSDKTRRRAYFLGENAEATTKRRRPNFTNLDFHSLQPVPINATTTNLPRATLAGHLLIESEDGARDPYVLASYATPRGVVVQSALTPLAVLGDVTITAGIVAVIGVVALAQSGASFSVR